ncbi:MAG: A/G-specific adenine glycosylase [Deltaproteobacteria bacterium]|nr:A/G-specific adenine glycosylase [Deltaproteobacteria bacterium]
MRSSARLPAATIARLRRALRRWYLRERRPLPWRKNHDSYRVWVAEVMLQQTRIAVVIPAYARFLKAFPTLRRLAAAEEDDVLSLWSGLGYYSRARSLHRAAQMLRAAGAAEFPLEYDEARKLPGVGSYTAAAVLSIAYDRPYAAVDGNVVRVLSRLFCLQRPGSKGEPHVALAQTLLDPKRPGDWNQAMMELGETVCTPAAPRCHVCPWGSACEARLRSAIDRHPPPKQRRSRERLELDLYLLRDRDRRLLLERGSFAHLPHLWLPPLRIVDRGEYRKQRPLATFHHAILHRDFNIAVYQRVLSDSTVKRMLRRRDGIEREMFSTNELTGIGRSSLLSKALALTTVPS